MRDITLLRDMLLFLKESDPPHGFGRLQKSFIKRIEREMMLDPLEIYQLCMTFVLLFGDSRTDCQPTKPWETLAEKIRKAVYKKRQAHVETDNIANIVMKMLLDKDEEKKNKNKDNKKYLFPFRPEDLVKKQETSKK